MAVEAGAEATCVAGEGGIPGAAALAIATIAAAGAGTRAATAIGTRGAATAAATRRARRAS